MEGGAYEVQVGASSQDIRLTGTVQLEGSTAPLPYDLDGLPSYADGQITEVSDREFSTLLGRPLPEARWNRAAPLELNDTFTQLSYAHGWVGRLTYRILKGQVDRAKARGAPDLNALFRLNMPFRGLAKMLGGAVDMAMAAALVEVFNGHFFRGMGHFVSAWQQKGRAARQTARKLAQGDGKA